MLLEVCKLGTRLPSHQPRSTALIEAHRACSNRTRVIPACVRLFTLPVVRSRGHCNTGLAQQDGGATGGLSGRCAGQLLASLTLDRQFGLAMIMPRL